MFSGKVMVSLVSDMEVESRTPEVPKTMLLSSMSLRVPGVVRVRLLRKGCFLSLTSFSAK